MSKTETAIKATYFSIISNTLLALIKGIAGYFGNSYAMIADAIESTADIFASFLVLFGIKYSNKPADENHPYGHGRAEPLITFIVVGFLIISATIIAYESIHNINTPHNLPKPFTLFILGAIILWKEYSFQTVLKKSKETNSSALKADAWHHRSDAITSVAAFIGISIALYFGKGYEEADDWAALLASGFIFYNCYKIFRPALGEIMDEHVYHELEDEIKRIAATVPNVIVIEKCFIRKAGMKYHVDLHLMVDGNKTVKEGHDIAHALKDTLRAELSELGHVLIHVEPDFESIHR
ncbi:MULTISPECIES: cation diffusion facilitator family transporter [Flavobacterium]|uniref:cation diffusion facilitator family transporter n=1 Tax=Flavobacterium TaxID=237 RepID=UPI001FCC87F5|nr:MULTISPECIES: cation diffusion facilitator family transporter [Flavobacterium]UOK41759.1 cation diffusion facilitator family transporter [Flavobacterium enshiense]